MPAATIIDVELRTLSPLHIGGTARMNTAADRALLKNIDGVPYVPATTLKGRLRHHLEQLFGSFSGPQPDEMPQPLSNDQVASLSPVETIFGTPWHESPIMFGDLNLTGPPQLFVDNDPTKPLRHLARRTTTRYGVSINRRRRVAQDHRLFTTEVFAPGVSLIFEGQIHAYISDEAVVLLVAGLESIDRIGGNRSRGFGQCEINVISPDIEPDFRRSVVQEWLS